MATTRIMPLHVGKGRTESRAISDIIDYVANPKKTDNGRLITGYACDSRTADAEFLLAKRLYITAMVDHAEYLIGVFDNQKKLRSGTAQTVNYALHQGKVITLIHPDTMEITAPAP